MEVVAGLMRGLKLSEEERRGVKIKVSMKEKGKLVAAQAVGKVLSERLAHPDAVRLSPGRVWCPIKGIECKEVGENLFVFTFNQESGKRRALEDGPWMFEKDLMVVEDYDPGKRLEEYGFNETPIWVRIFNLPLGMMNAEAAEEIGNVVGSFVEADVGMDGSALGKFLRVKIRMKLDKPIMRGFTLDDEEHEARQQHKRMGHGQKACSTKLAKGEKAQFGGWLQADMGRRKLYGEEEGPWRGRGRGAGGARSFGAARSFEKSGSGSDSLSWRKDDSRSTEGRRGEAEKGEEVTSPPKLPATGPKDLGRPKKLILEGQAVEEEVIKTRYGGGRGDPAQVEQTHNTQEDGAEGFKDAQSHAGREERVQQLPTTLMEEKLQGVTGMQKKAPGQRRFKRVGRDHREDVTFNQTAEQVIGSKRAMDGEGEQEKSKKGSLEEEEGETGGLDLKHGGCRRRDVLR
ncbi:LRR receptor-like serine/threonine-protein kinase FLS2 [Hordeum vulgare]|nr:LRR receptor-like serine/threonine-protein kinase FLS2 [Hordeum vulgare]